MRSPLSILYLFLPLFSGNKIHEALVTYDESELIVGGTHAIQWDGSDINQEADSLDVEDFIDGRIADSAPMTYNGKPRAPGRDVALGPTYLHIAALRHRGGVLCQELINQGADVRHEMEIEGRFPLYHLTPFQVAVYFGNTNCLRVMLPLLRPRELNEEISIAANIETALGAERGSQKGGSLLSHAADAGYFEIYRLLMDHGAKVDLNSYLYAVQRNHLEMVTYMLQNLRIDVNYVMVSPSNVDIATVSRIKADTALHAAAERGYEAMCELLIRHGAHVNAVTHSDKMRPLDVALESYNGACRKYSDYRGRTFNCTGLDASIKVLRKYGANPGLGESRQYLFNESFATRLAEREAMLFETFGPQGMPKPFTPNVTEDDMLQTDGEQFDWEKFDELTKQEIDEREKRAEDSVRKLRADREAAYKKWADMPESQKDRIRQETLDAIAPGAQSLENQIKRAIATNPNGEVERKLIEREAAMKKADEMAAANSRKILQQIEDDLKRQKKEEEKAKKAKTKAKAAKAKQDL